MPDFESVASTFGEASGINMAMLQRALFTGGMMLLTVVALSAQQGFPRLRNSGFEDADLSRDWKAWIYKEGKDPEVGVDQAEAKEGWQSLLVRAETPADVALGQVITLPAASVWRVRCWVKTENLVARDRTETGGTVHVQTPGGATLSRGSSAFGSSPWREVEAVFRVPADGQVKIVLFFIGYGKGTGKVWFDDVRLEEIETGDRQAIRIYRERVTQRPVDGKQCGQFIELLCGLVPSMLAQQVANTSFEEEPPWKVAFRRETDQPHRPWYPDGAVHMAHYSFDTNRPFNGQRSMRIDLRAPRVRAGLAQDGFSVQAGLGYHLRLHARSEGDITVRAVLHGGGRIVAAPANLGRTGPDWAPLQATLQAGQTVANASLTLDFERPGTLWLDRVSLISDDAVLGLWRRDVVEAVRQMNPGMIRFGGSTLEDYQWDQALGSPDMRAPFPVSYWGGLEENFVGVEEFAALCREIGAEPLVCVRWTGKKPEDAAAEVEYFNGGAETPWGKRRAQNGHTEPWGVKFWQVGNEVAGAAYDASLHLFAQAMRRVDPSIRVLSSFPSPDTLRLGGNEVDYLCPHHYACADLVGTEESFLSLEDQIRHWTGSRPVRIAVTEWNTTAADWELARAQLQTLANALACARYHNLMQRHCDTVEIAIRSNLIDSFGSGVIQTGPGWLYLAPTYHAQRLYARAAGSFPVRLERIAAASARLPWPMAEPDLSAVLSSDGHTLRVYGVNSTKKPLSVTTALTGFGTGVVKGEAQVLKDAEGSLTPEVLNTRDEPGRVRVFRQPAPLQGSNLELAFEPFSLTLYELELP
jgi:alpha-L-arabinofuranosidase